MLLACSVACSYSRPIWLQRAVSAVARLSPWAHGIAIFKKVASIEPAVVQILVYPAVIAVVVEFVMSYIGSLPFGAQKDIWSRLCVLVVWFEFARRANFALVTKKSFPSKFWMKAPICFSLFHTHFCIHWNNFECCSCIDPILHLFSIVSTRIIRISSFTKGVNVDVFNEHILCLTISFTSYPLMNLAT